MGSAIFAVDKTVSKETTTQNTFTDLRMDALIEYGHGGYTGSIAEKHTCAPCPYPLFTDAEIKDFIQGTLYHYGNEPARFSETLIDKICDKAAPAWYVRLSVSDTEDTIVFFGNAPC